jgi:nucleoside phosphorylase/ribosomal protein S13
MGENIYYHFFDRELRQSVNANISDENICKIISVSLFMSDGIFYLPISHLYESYSEFPKSFDLLKKLESIGVVCLVSGHDSIENFILSRQEMYKHDKDRYPMYFKDDIDIWSSNLIVLENSTTEILRKNFSSDKIIIKELDDDKIHHINKIIKNTVENDKSKAITYSLFKNKISLRKYRNAVYNVVSSNIKNQISKYYIQRYLNITSGTIITGIESIQQYDFLAKDSFSTNYYIYTKILKIIGADIDLPSFSYFVVSLKKERELFEIIITRLNCLTHSLSNLLKDKKIGLMHGCNKYLHSGKTYSKICDASSFFANVLVYLDDICNNHEDLFFEIDKMNKNRKSLILVVVTKIELDALFDAINIYCPRQYLIDRISGDLVYKELFGCKLPVYIVQSEMGISGTGSIMNTISKVNKYLNPEKILMVGIAFGINEEEQKIGDILVSKQIWNYEPSKITETRNIGRGDKIPASSSLIQLFRSVRLNKEVMVHFGLLASGEKLINSKKYLNELKSIEPELIGGDMEAAGLVSVCYNNHIDWLVIKAICDWGYDKNGKNQVRAANNACDYLMRGLIRIIF